MNNVPIICNPSTGLVGEIYQQNILPGVGHCTVIHLMTIAYASLQVAAVFQQVAFAFPT